MSPVCGFFVCFMPTFLFLFSYLLLSALVKQFSVSRIAGFVLFPLKKKTMHDTIPNITRTIMIVGPFNIIVIFLIGKFHRFNNKKL